MSPQSPIRPAPDARIRLGTFVRVVLSSPILVLILLLAVSAAADVPSTADPLEAVPFRVAPQARDGADGPTLSRRILGLDVAALTGSLVDDRLHHQSGYALPWARGPLELGARALGLSWGWRF